MSNDALAAPAPLVDDPSPAPTRPEPVRPAADRFMRRLLLIRDPRAGYDERRVYGLFSTSILISATRCILSYIVFPIFAPFISQATGTGPIIGLIVGVVALTFDVLSIRRFWAADHRYRWPMTAIYSMVIVLVSVLLVQDLMHLFG
jgi:hypothetical protein